MPEFIRIKGWAKYQHYKDRNPPWIKLHRELLTSLTWAMADDASRVLAVACMLLAAATDNKIPFDSGYVRRVAYLNGDPDFSQLLKLEFLEVIDDKGHVVLTAITPLADASKLQAFARPETETETEQRKRKKKPSSNSRLMDEVFTKSWAQYPRKVGKGAAEKAWPKAVAKHAEELGPDAGEIIYQRVMTYAAFCKHSAKPKEFTPHMATWLNEDRFLDDPSEWTVTEKPNVPGNSKAQRVQDESLDAIRTAVSRINGRTAGQPESSVSRPERDSGNSGVVLDGISVHPPRSRAASAGNGSDSGNA